MIPRSENKKRVRVLITLEKTKRAMNSEEKQDHRRSPKNSEDAKNSLSHQRFFSLERGDLCRH